MKLLKVAAVLDREKGIQKSGHENEVLEVLDDKTPDYAILSHRWENEVSYKEMIKLIKMGEDKREEVRQRDGYQKVIRACEQAMTDAYGWLWIDTCCIDKRCSEKLSEAINSMYRWYHNSQKCYVYLNDVDESVFPTEQDFSKFGMFNGWPEWFSRGWTLQELIAPKEVEFFNKRWESLGNKRDLTSTLEKITRIPEKVLRDEQVLRTRERPCIAHIMSWAADRKTTRVEDRAYSLLGFFGVEMQVLYGEGSKAFRRLQLEILRVSGDHSVFAWNPKGRLRGRESVLADDPSCFRGCHDIEKLDPTEFSKELEVYIFLCGFAVDADEDKLDSLRRGVGSSQLSTFDVTNLGIQVSLPVVSNRDSPYFKAILPCRDRDGKLITIDLESLGHSFCKCLSAPHIRKTWPESRSLFLDYSQDDKVKSRNLRLYDRRLSWYGFIRCGTFPFEIVGDTVLLSQGNNLIVLVYANHRAKSRFAVGLGCCHGKAWARIVCDEDPANQETWSSWATFAKEVYHILWNAPFDESYFLIPRIAIKDTHLPRSIWDARIICRRISNSDSTDVMMDIQKCPGCCAGPLEYTAMSEDCDLWLPWPQGHSSRTFTLQLDGQVVSLDECSGQGIALGDYGDTSADWSFKRQGNIFEDMQALGIDPTDSSYCPVFSRVSSCEGRPHRAQARHDVVVISCLDENMALHQPNGLSLPDNEEFELLLKALSTRLVGNYFVTTIIQCSELYKVDCEGRRVDVGSSSSIWSAVPSTRFTALCTFSIPQAWHKEPACEQRREQFKSIREHFYALANLHHLVTCDKSADKLKMNTMVDYSAIFGLEHLKNFVGEIMFFKELPSIMETRMWSKMWSGDSIGTGGVHPLNPSSRIVAPLLLEKCKELGRGSLHEKRKTQTEVEYISQTLSVELLEHIRTAFLDGSEDEPSRQIDPVGQINYATVPEIVALQEKLQATKDEDERRALEEDITGKILWFYRHGIRSEVGKLLANIAHTRWHYEGLHEMAEIIKGASHVHIHRDNDISHLWRIMLDAGAGLSRHELWLAARTAEDEDSRFMRNRGWLAAHGKQMYQLTRYSTPVHAAGDDDDNSEGQQSPDASSSQGPLPPAVSTAAHFPTLPIIADETVTNVGTIPLTLDRTALVETIPPTLDSTALVGTIPLTLDRTALQPRRGDGRETMGGIYYVSGETALLSYPNEDTTVTVFQQPFASDTPVTYPFSVYHMDPAKTAAFSGCLDGVRSYALSDCVGSGLGADPSLPMVTDKMVPSTSHAASSDRIACPWRSHQQSICGMPVGWDCSDHLAAVHGIINMPSNTVLECGVCGRQKKRRSFLRHFREMHLGFRRRKRETA